VRRLTRKRSSQRVSDKPNRRRERRTRLRQHGGRGSSAPSATLPNEEEARGSHDDEVAPLQTTQTSIDIDVSDLDRGRRRIRMTVVNNGKLTKWVWTFAGLGSPKDCLLQSNRMARERLHADNKEKEQARTNGKMEGRRRASPMSEQERTSTSSWRVAAMVAGQGIGVESAVLVDAAMTAAQSARVAACPGARLSSRKTSFFYEARRPV